MKKDKKTKLQEKIEIEKLREKLAKAPLRDLSDPKIFAEMYRKYSKSIGPKLKKIRKRPRQIIFRNIG